MSNAALTTVLLTLAVACPAIYFVGIVALNKWSWQVVSAKFACGMVALFIVSVLSWVFMIQKVLEVGTDGATLGGWVLAFAGLVLAVVMTGCAMFALRDLSKEKKPARLKMVK